MKKLVLSAAVLAAIGMTSCTKDDVESVTESSFAMEASAEEYIVNVSSTDYDTRVTQPLTFNGDLGVYTAGIIEYVEKGKVTSTIDFGDGADDEATLTDYTGKKKKKLCKDKKDGSKYKKVIVEPLVKSDDCDYIVAGVIKYFEDKKWVATVDYGDGTCDDIATKTTKDGVYQFNM